MQQLLWAGLAGENSTSGTPGMLPLPLVLLWDFQEHSFPWTRLFNTDQVGKCSICCCLATPGLTGGLESQLSKKQGLECEHSLVFPAHQWQKWQNCVKAAPNPRISLGGLPVHPCCSQILLTAIPAGSGQLGEPGLGHSAAGSAHPEKWRKQALWRWSTCQSQTSLSEKLENLPV